MSEVDEDEKEGERQRKGQATATRAMVTAKMWAMATATRVADDEGVRE